MKKAVRLAIAAVTFCSALSIFTVGPKQTKASAASTSTPISGPALEWINSQTLANRQRLYVYLNSDSGANIGFFSGFLARRCKKSI